MLDFGFFNRCLSEEISFFCEFFLVDDATLQRSTPEFLICCVREAVSEFEELNLINSFSSPCLSYLSAISL